MEVWLDSVKIFFNGCLKGNVIASGPATISPSELVWDREGHKIISTTFTRENEDVAVYLDRPSLNMNVSIVANIKASVREGEKGRWKTYELGTLHIAQQKTFTADGSPEHVWLAFFPRSFLTLYGLTMGVITVSVASILGCCMYVKRKQALKASKRREIEKQLEMLNELFLKGKKRKDY